MAFLGKEFVHYKDDNFEAFLRSSGLTEDKVQAELKQSPKVKFVKNADGTYTLTTTTGGNTKEVTFTSGVEFDDIIGEGKVTIKNVYNVDGNVITQVVKAPHGVATFKREFDGNDLVVSITSTNFDGVAKRYYKA